ncbi:hypothetical protein H480_44075 [Amycolatopsis vancoresmycina DSM 44592]|uniref:Uncharacterized protein n=1 Tax=Amycolatopsis vancoresmycina DSM 44592 TaxID=1292037 RepID=R1H1W6_9PSEU|nr:hypothetical protein H480_44075 [Amycolatopsis vancoresmycina DSM 44592]
MDATAHSGTGTPLGVPVVPDVYSSTSVASPLVVTGTGCGGAASSRSKLWSPGWSTAPVVITVSRHAAGMSSLGPSFARCPGSVTTIRAPLPAIRPAIDGGASAVNRGTWTAPIRQIASSVTTRSADLPSRVATRSPGPAPSSASAVASRAEESCRAAKVQSREDRSGSTTVNATASPGCRSHSSSAARTRGRSNRERRSSTRRWMLVIRTSWTYAIPPQCRTVAKMSHRGESPATPA